MRKIWNFCCVAYVESESGVLPLNYAPMCATLYIALFGFAINFLIIYTTVNFSYTHIYHAQRITLLNNIIK